MDAEVVVTAAQVSLAKQFANPTFIGMGLLVALSSLYRFKIFENEDDVLHGRPVSELTTLANRLWASAVYMLIAVGIYVFLVSCFVLPGLGDALEAIVQAVIPGIDMRRGEFESNEAGIWAASTLTILGQSLPYARDAERTIRIGLYTQCGAPHRWLGLVDDLENQRPHMPHRATLSAAQTSGFASTDDYTQALQSPEKSARQLYLHCHYLIERLKRLKQRDIRVSRFVRTNQSRLNRIETALGNVCATLADVQQTDRTTESLRLVRRDLLGLLASIIFSVAWTEPARRDTQVWFGFDYSHGRTLGFDAFAVALTFAVTLFFSFLSGLVIWLIVDRVHVDTLPFLWEIGFRIACLHTVAIAASLIAHFAFEEWRGDKIASDRRRLDKMRHNGWLAGIELVAGWAAGMVIVLILADAQITLLTAVFLGAPAGAAALSFFWLSTRGRSPMSDAFIQGATTAFATLIAVSLFETFEKQVFVLFEQSLIGQAGLADEHWNGQLISTVAPGIAFVVGAVIGFILPARQRMRKDVRVDRKSVEVAVIGAGVAGLSCAQRLQQLGFDVIVFEKFGTPGGRLRSPNIDRVNFDLGAQSFDEALEKGGPFSRQVDIWKAHDCVAPWPAQVCRLKSDGSAERTVRSHSLIGVPNMAAVAEQMATIVNDDQDSTSRIRYRQPIDAISRNPQGWSIYDENQHMVEIYDYVVIATPPSEAHRILGDVSASWSEHARLAGERSMPCWVVVLAFDEPLSAPDADDVPDIYRFEASDMLFQATHQSAKPNNPAVPEPQDAHLNRDVWVLHAQLAWSASQGLDEIDTGPAIAEVLCEEFWKLTGMGRATPAVSRARRLDQAIIGAFDDLVVSYDDGTDRWHYFDEAGVGACGDWCVRWGVGHAWASGLRLADTINANHRSGRGV